MRGSTWSPDTSSFNAGQYRQACSGEWPVPTMTCQSCAPMRTVSPSDSRWKLSGKAWTYLPKPPKRVRYTSIASSSQPALR
jgi:hypothetical protein